MLTKLKLQLSNFSRVIRDLVLDFRLKNQMFLSSLRLAIREFQLNVQKSKTRTNIPQQKLVFRAYTMS
jgi:hypothetical protein